MADSSDAAEIAGFGDAFDRRRDCRIPRRLQRMERRRMEQTFQNRGELVFESRYCRNRVGFDVLLFASTSFNFRAGKNRKI